MMERASPTWSVVMASASLLVPVAAIAVFLAVEDPRARGGMFGILAAVFAGGFASGAVSLIGLKDGLRWSLLTAALLGMALNALLGGLALFVLALSGLPRC
jgi:hypothetical protein